MKDEKRRHLRYRFETCHLAKASFRPQGLKEVARPVLVANISYSGCNLIAIAGRDEVFEGDDLILQFDASDFAEVSVVRVESLTGRALRLGCRFID